MNFKYVLLLTPPKPQPPQAAAAFYPLAVTIKRVIIHFSMNKEEIKDYRKILEKEYSDKDSEIESTISYITIAALGFFITINKEFFKLNDSTCKYLLIVSLISMFISFVLLLIRKSKTSQYDFEMMTFMDKMRENSADDDQELLKMWDKGQKVLAILMTTVYCTLAIGIGLQIVFLWINL